METTEDLIKSLDKFESMEFRDGLIIIHIEHGPNIYIHLPEDEKKRNSIIKEALSHFEIRQEDKT